MDRPSNLIPCFIAVVLLLHVTGCVIVPHPVSHEVERTDQIGAADELYISVGPRELLDEVSGLIVKHNPDIELVDPLEFRDAAFPDGGWSLEEFLDTKKCTQVAEKLDMQYLVLLLPAQVETGEEKGFLIPFLGAMAASEDSTLAAIIIDLRSGTMVSQLSATSSGKGAMLYYVIFMVATDPMTESAVIKGLSESIAETLVSGSHTGSLRIAVLAGEVLDETNGQSSVPIQLTGTDWNLLKDIGAYCPNAELGHPDAQVYIGDLYYLGAYDIEKDIIQAYVWYRLAADNGSAYAAEKVGKLENEMSDEHLVEARENFEHWQAGNCRQDLLDAASISPE